MSIETEPLRRRYTPREIVVAVIAMAAVVTTVIFGLLLAAEGSTLEKSNHGLAAAKGTIGQLEDQVRATQTTAANCKQAASDLKDAYTTAYVAAGEYAQATRDAGSLDSLTSDLIIGNAAYESAPKRAASVYVAECGAK